MLPPQCRTKETNVFGLYHNRYRLKDLRDQIIKDLESCIPHFSSPSITLATPLFSTIDGQPIYFSESQSLANICSIILDMILLEPVDWVAVQKSIFSVVNHAATTRDIFCEILNFGPGYGVSKGKHSFPENTNFQDVWRDTSDWRSEDGSAALSPNDIAIVGMAVDLPDAPDTVKFWDNLIKGVDSCREVRISANFIPNT